MGAFRGNFLLSCFHLVTSCHISYISLLLLNGRENEQETLSSFHNSGEPTSLTIFWVSGFLGFERTWKKIYGMVWVITISLVPVRDKLNGIKFIAYEHSNCQGGGSSV